MFKVLDKIKGLNRAVIGGSLLLLITFNIFNALNFLYHFAMARLLSIADYGILATLFSIIYIFSILTESFQTVITRYSSREADGGKLKNIILRSFKRASKTGFFIFILYLAAAFPLSFALKINYWLMALNGIIIFLALFSPITRGIMQGRKMFNALGLNMIIESGTKFILALVLVVIGWKVYGAILATIVGGIVAIALSFFALKKILRAKEGTANLSDIYAYSMPVFVTIFAILVFYSLDLIIAKIVFSPDVAGYYAIASMLGKIIFFGTEPISKAMFPLSAEDKSKKGKSAKNVFVNALGILMFCIISALLVYYFFPEIVVRIYSGRYIPESASILFYVALATSLLSLTNLILLYKISTGKLRGYWYFLAFIALEIFMLSYFSNSLMQFSLAFIAASAVFLWWAVFLMNKSEE